MEKAHFSKSFQRSHIGIFLESMRAILEVRTFSHFGTTSIYGPKNLRGHVGPYPGTPKFLIQFYKLQSPPNMWQSLVAIGPDTSKIRRLKRV